VARWKSILEGVSVKILVTGATGFIGSHLVHRLLREEHEVGIIKRSISKTWRINDILDQLTVFETDLQDLCKIQDAIETFQPCVVFHLASQYVTEHTPADIKSLYETNVLGTVNLLDSMIDSTVTLFVNTSSCFVYGSGSYSDKDQRMSEGDFLNPSNLYALTKVHGEEACSYYAERYGVKCVTLRLFPPYGEWDNERKLIPFVIRKMIEGEELQLTSCKQKWDFTYIDDIIDAYMKILFILEFPEKHEIFNIGTGYAPSMKRVVLMIKDILGSDIKPKFGTIPHRNKEVWYTCADTSAAQKYLNWRPETKLKEGLRKTVNWYKEDK